MPENRNNDALRTAVRVGLINTSATRGGAAKAAVTLLRALNESDVPVAATLYHASDRMRGNRIVGLRKPGARQLNAVLFRVFGERGMLDLGVAADIIRMQSEFDLLHLHNLHGYYLDYSKLLRNTSPLPLVWTWHDMWGATGRCGFSAECEHWLRGCGNCPRTDYYPAAWIDWSASDYQRKRDLFMTHPNLNVISPSQWLAKIASKHGFPVERITVIPNAVDLSAFQCVDMYAARAALELEEEQTYLLFVAADCRDPRKGFDDFADIVNQTGFRGIAVGLPPQHAHPRIHLTGPISDSRILNLYYSASDAMIMTSHIDNYPNTVIEAQASGTPVFAYPTGGIPEQLPPFWNGLSNARNASALAEPIYAWLNNRSNAGISALAQELRRFAIQTWGPHAIAGQHAALYRRILESR